MTKQTTTISLAEARKEMDIYVQSYKNKVALRATIANEIKAYDDNMRRAEEKLLAFAEANRDSFDAKDNLDLGTGYLHVAQNSTVVMKPKFDAKAFAKKFPLLIEMKKAFKMAEIKKLFIKDAKTLKAMGVELTTTEAIEVKVHEPVED